MIHPEIVIVERMVDAVGSNEGEAHGGDTEKIQEYGVIGAASDAGVGEPSVRDRLVLAQFGLARNFPLVVKSFSGWRRERAADLDQQRRERADGIALEI